MSATPRHTVLFDLDGTLVDTRKLYAAAFTHAFDEVLETPPDFAALRARRPTSERTFLLEWFGHEVGARVHEAMIAFYDAHAGELLRGFYPGVAEMVQDVVELGYSVGVVTGKSRAACEITARHVDLSVFEIIVTEDDVPAAKPDPAGICQALRAMGADTGVYVGDTPMDLEAAHRADLRAAAALWAFPQAKRAATAQALDGRVWALGRPMDLVTRLDHQGSSDR